MFKPISLFLFFLCLAGCKPETEKQPTPVNHFLLADKNATKATQILYQNLARLKEKGILFGHQDDLAYGVNWKYEENRSDVKDVTGDYPAVYGWDIAGLEKKAANNIDGVPFDKMKQYIKAVHQRGGVNTISWHIDNPLTGKDAWDTTPGSLASALPGGKSHEKYKTWLDEGVQFFLSLKDQKGELIPILFRPYHELTGDWFWWCKNNGSPKEYKALWKFTFDYFQQKGLQNLIYVYNTSMVKTKAEYLEYYPGTEYADVLSFDNYQYTDPKKDNSFVENGLNLFGIMDSICQEQNKIMAFAETGYEQIPYDKWWTDTLLKTMGNYKISYVLVWRNHGWQEKEQKSHYYAPYPGHPSVKDFVDFYDLEKILFEQEAAAAKLYQ